MRAWKWPFIAIAIAFFSTADHCIWQRETKHDLGNFTIVLPPGWTASSEMYLNATELYGPGRARVIVTTERRRDPEEARRRLGDIASEEPGANEKFIDNRQAVLRIFEKEAPSIGKEGAQSFGSKPSKHLRVTIAVASGSLLVRLEGSVPLPATPETEVAVRQIDEIGHSLKFKTEASQGNTKGAERRFKRLFHDAGREFDAGDACFFEASLGDAGTPSGAPVLVLPSFGEFEIAASADGKIVVVASSEGHSRSTNSGAEYDYMGLADWPVTMGDPSIATGRSGTFYSSLIGIGLTGWCAISVGVTGSSGPVVYRSDAFRCAQVTNVGDRTCFPDQGHLASDRVNGTDAGDQVYSVWRNFPGDGTEDRCDTIDRTLPDPVIVCSTNGARKWSTPTVVGTGDYPRITVGPDGFVWVVYHTGRLIMVNKFSSCDSVSPLQQQEGFPVAVAEYTNPIPCPVPGLDRCNNGNTLSSPTIAIDETRADHVYVAYATSTGQNNDDVLVVDSVDHGMTWRRPVRVNARVDGRRFMPWMCVLGGVAHVGWYDRRSATPQKNDLTSYYRGGVRMNEESCLVVGEEVLLSEQDDPQCASGWPGGTRSSDDSDSCSGQPQGAGFCSGGNSRCDYDSSTGCDWGEVCLTYDGQPKYGDYNGIACGGGYVFAAWSTGTPVLTGHRRSIRIVGNTGK